MKQRKIPLRKCVITNEQFPKQELIRVVRDPEGQVSVDLTGKKNGRGAYLCRKKSVILKARKTKKLNRHLNTIVPDEIYDELLKLIDEQ
jgi:predicted RNA-binding protein YlxR (DUF448 family)